MPDYESERPRSETQRVYEERRGSTAERGPEGLPEDGAVPSSLQELVESSAEAWRSRDYQVLARLNREAFGYCRLGIERSLISRLLVEAGSIGYVPVA